ncbi:MAG: hypothetical protein JHC33_10565 [Ignisphaera sp.]|nr:hypothetical protein [Ignisphaera sp.]
MIQNNMKLVNPIKKLVELFQPTEVSPLKNLAPGHPQKQYSYTLVGNNLKPINATSLISLGFLGQIPGATDYVISHEEMLFKDLNTVVKIAMSFNISRIRKYHDTGHGIEWESNSRDVYKKLIDVQLFRD